MKITLNEWTLHGMHSYFFHNKTLELLNGEQNLSRIKTNIIFYNAEPLLFVAVVSSTITLFISFVSYYSFCTNYMLLRIITIFEWTDRNEISQNQSVLINNVTKTFSNLSTIG